MVEGFIYKSYPAELVKEIVNRYLADTTLEQLSLQLEGVSFAGAQRVIDYAILIGALSPEEKHPNGGGFARKRARAIWQRHPEATAPEIARLAECTESTAYRAKRGK